MESKFKIVEYMGRFIINRRVVERRGLFRRRKIETWRPIDIFGRPLYGIYQKPYGPVNTLEEAEAVVEALKKETREYFNGDNKAP